MRNRWVVKGDFNEIRKVPLMYQFGLRELPYVRRQVSYINDVCPSSIASLTVEHMLYEEIMIESTDEAKQDKLIKTEKSKVVVTFNPSPLSDLLGVVKRGFFTIEELAGAPLHQEITLHTEEDLKKLIRFLLLLNEKSKREEFPKELRDALENNFFTAYFDFHYGTIQVSETKDLIKANNRKKPRYHPIGSNPSMFNIKELENALVTKKFDPTEALFAVSEYPTDALELLLTYEANPFARMQNGLNDYAYVEVCKVLQNYEHLTTISSTFMPPEKPILDNNASIVDFVIPEAKHADQLVMQTFFLLNDGRLLISNIQPSATLTAEEMHNLSECYRQFFKAKEPNEQKKVFENDTIGEDIFIDRIFANGKLVGFNLFKIIKNENPEEPVTYFLIASYLDPSFRKFELGRIQGFRVPFSLQMLSPEQTIAIFYFAIHANGYRLSKEIANKFPLLQPPHIMAKVNKLLKLIYKEDLKYTHDELTSYVDDIAAALISEKDFFDLHAKTFYKFILQLKNVVNVMNSRAAPVYFFVDDQSAACYTKAAKKVSLDFISLCSETASKGKPLFKKYVNNPNKLPWRSFARSNLLFLNNARVLNDAYPDYPKPKKTPYIAARM